MTRMSIVFTCDSEPIGLYDIERRLRAAGFTRPQARFDHARRTIQRTRRSLRTRQTGRVRRMNHFDELAIVERANSYRDGGR